MAVSLVSTGIQFPDASIQTTAASAGSPSAMVYLSTVTITSNTANVDIENAFNSTYSTYVIIANNVNANASSNNSRLYCRLKVGGTYQTSGYRWQMTDNTSGSGSSFSGAGSANYSESYIMLARDLGTSTLNWSSVMYITNPAGTSDQKNIYGAGGYLNTGPYQINNTYSASYYASNAALTGVRFYIDPNSGGNISSGTWRLYGIKAS